VELVVRIDTEEKGVEPVRPGLDSTWYILPKAVRLLKKVAAFVFQKALRAHATAISYRDTQIIELWQMNLQKVTQHSKDIGTLWVFGRLQYSSVSA